MGPYVSNIRTARAVPTPVGLLFGPGSTGDVVVLLVSLALEPLFRRERARVATVGFETGAT